MTPDWYVLACMAFVGIMAVLTAACCVAIWRQRGDDTAPYFSPQTDAARADLYARDADAERGRA